MTGPKNARPAAAFGLWRVFAAFLALSGCRTSEETAEEAQLYAEAIRGRTRVIRFAQHEVTCFVIDNGYGPAMSCLRDSVRRCEAEP